MNHLGPDAEPAGQGRLDDRVLDALQRMHGRMAFSGLRRSLGAHPESLARALRRLEREGLIEHETTGYRALNAPRVIATSSEASLRSVAQIEMPLGLESEGILARLTGRWFGELRWVGVVERPPDRLLSWARRDGTGRVLLGARGGSLHIYTASGRGEGDPDDSDDAAYDLLVAVADTLRPTGPARPVAFLAAAQPEAEVTGPLAHSLLGSPVDN